MGRGEGGGRRMQPETRMIQGIENDVSRAVARVNQLERKLKQIDYRNAKIRKENERGGGAWRDTGFRTAGASPNHIAEIRVSRGSKKDGTYEEKWIPEGKYAEYLKTNHSWSRNTTEADIRNALLKIKNALGGDYDNYKSNYRDYLKGMQVLTSVANRYKGDNYIDMSQIRTGSAFSVSGDAKKEISKIEKLLGIDILKGTLYE